MLKKLSLLNVVAVMVGTQVPAFLSAAPLIKGTYLPESELPASVCQIIGHNVQEIMTPIDANNKPIAAPFVFRTQAKVDFCSATVIGKDHIITAAHCTQLNHEQGVQIVKYPIPKFIEETVNGVTTKVRPKGCTDENWGKIPECILGKGRARAQIKFGKMEAYCPNKGDPEARDLEMTTMWPNPLFSVHRPHYDVSIMKVATPWTKVPIMPMMTSAAELLETIQDQHESCRSFGYGLDNEDKTGTLHGAYTPANYLQKNWIIAKTNENWVDSGDSGGALICKTKSGADALVGVVSLGGDITNLDMNVPSEYKHYNGYPSLAYNSLWIKIALDPKRTPHGGLTSSDEWHKIALDYDFSEIGKIRHELKLCMRQVDHLLERLDRKEMNQRIADANAHMAKAESERNRSAVSARSYVRNDLYLLQAALDTCQTLM